MAETETVKIKSVKAYKVILSTKHEIKIDADEVASVIEGIKTGSIVRVRQGIFNPSYFVCIERDKDRIDRFLEDTKYDDARSLSKRRAGMLPLADILEDVKLKRLPEAPRRPELPAASSEQHG
jgi:hypothetical protein